MIVHDRFWYYVLAMSLPAMKEKQETQTLDCRWCALSEQSKNIFSLGRSWGRFQGMPLIQTDPAYGRSF